MFLRHTSPKVRLLQESPLFDGLPQKQLDVIARHADQVRLDAGDAWTRRTRIPRELLFIVEGRAQVERRGQVIGCLGAGDFFGDLELLDGQRRNEEVIAEIPTVVMVAEARSLSFLFGAIPELRTRVLDSLRGRLVGAEPARRGPGPRPGRRSTYQPPEPVAASGPRSS